tara:strand:+ start:71964 stop:73481 length:1518 start_codon:yes stop_codon:yes gene_type:complete
VDTFFHLYAFVIRTAKIILFTKLAPSMRTLFSLSIFFVLILTSCEKKSGSSNASFLGFSQDTVLFDTVFTARGTATKIFKIFNNSKESMAIKRIALRNANTFFRFNIDGYSGVQVENIEILPNDSAFVFMDANIDPNGSSSPLVIEDALVFDFETGTKELPIVAYGQDAVYITPNVFPSNIPAYSLLDSVTVWTNEKPYVVFGYAVVDSMYSLTIEAGAKIYFHSGGGLWIYRDGDLTAKGTVDNPILFQSDRLESFYANSPGQWDRIWINEGANDVVIEHTIIKNSVIGLQIETLPFSYNITAPVSARKVTVNNTIIKNCSSSGLFLRNSKIALNNVEISNCGQHTVAITGGGEYTLNHVTSANYWTAAVRKTPSFFASNAYKDGNGNIQVRNLNTLNITNSVFVGNNDVELDFETIEPGVNNLSLNYSSIYTDDANKYSGGSQLSFNLTPNFVSRFNSNYRLGTDSPFINKGTGSIVNKDLLNRPRDAQPDLGAYEYDLSDQD